MVAYDATECQQLFTSWVVDHVVRDEVGAEGEIEGVVVEHGTASLDRDCWIAKGGEAGEIEAGAPLIPRRVTRIHGVPISDPGSASTEEEHKY